MENLLMLALAVARLAAGSPSVLITVPHTALADLKQDYFKHIL